MKLILAIALVLAPALSYAGSLFPFHTFRSDDGKIISIELTEISRSSSQDSKDAAEIQAKKEKLERDGYFHLLAAPNDPGAFEARRRLATGVGAAVDVAKAAIGVSPFVGAASSVLSQHVRNLEARRAFYQNVLLVYLDHTSEFTAKEKSHIRSSIFYSRIGLTQSHHRAAARASWSTYGDQKLAELYAKCADKNPNPNPAYGVCFKAVDNKIENLMVGKDLLRHSPATNYMFNQPHFVEHKRYALMGAKVGTSFVPVPGFGLVSHLLINSMYDKQRRSEGFLYAQLVLSGNLELAKRIRKGSANPLM